MKLFRPPDSRIQTIIGNRLRIKRVEKKLWTRIIGVRFGDSLDDEPIYEAEIVQVGTQFEWHDHLDVGDKVFVQQKGGLVLADKSILISALDLVAARHNGKIEKVNAPTKEDVEREKKTIERLGYIPTTQNF